MILRPRHVVIGIPDRARDGQRQITQANAGRDQARQITINARIAEQRPGNRAARRKRGTYTRDRMRGQLRDIRIVRRALHFVDEVAATGSLDQVRHRAQRSVFIAEVGSALGEVVVVREYAGVRVFTQHFNVALPCGALRFRQIGNIAREQLLL